MSVSSGSFGDGGGLGLRPDQGLYPISVVAQLTGIEAHTLRGYERAGLLSPTRSPGGSRRYSDNDLARLRRIWSLSGDRVNLEGIRRILLLEQEVASLRAEIERLRDGSGERNGPAGASPAR
jgi:MerR family transcriptional regulator/heat shock protein HspR